MNPSRGESNQDFTLVRVFELRHSSLSQQLIHGFRTCLSPEEQARADAIRKDSARNSFIYTRGALRTLLAYYTNGIPEGIQLESTISGKPTLKIASAQSCHFNVSHSGNYSLIAVSTAAEIGIDIQQIDKLARVRALSSRFYTTNEAERIASMPEELQAESFFRAWARKEAYLKCVGCGLSGGLDSIDVSAIQIGEPYVCDRIEGAIALQDLDAPEGYFAAVAVASPGIRIEYAEREWLL